MKTMPPLLINQLPDQRMGRKVFTRWLNGRLLELVASEAGLTNLEELAVVIRDGQAMEAVLNLLDEIIIFQTLGFGIQTLLAPWPLTATWLGNYYLREISSSSGFINPWCTTGGSCTILTRRPFLPGCVATSKNW